MSSEPRLKLSRINTHAGTRGVSTPPPTPADPASENEHGLAGDTDDKRRLEGRARRAARWVGLLVRKSRQQTHVPNLDNFGELVVVDGERGYVVAASRFKMSAEEVLEFCTRRGRASKNAAGT